MQLFSHLKVAIVVVTIFQLIVASTADPKQPTSTQFTFQPTRIPIDDPELVNPGRGFYRWRGVENVPAAETAYDEYDRYYWHDPDHPELSLEISPGVYNFSQLDQAISAAASRGHKFAFRVRTMANKRSGKRFVPDYLSECGWSYKGTFIPDWNSACFLDNAEKLMEALGARYDGDPRVAWVEIGLYGEWGEWALSNDTYNSAPQEYSMATDRSLARIIDIQVNAFPNVRKVMLAKTRADAVIHALAISDQIGWRVDCFGKDGYFDFASNPKYMPAWETMRDRWKTAPVIVEFCTDSVNLSSSIPLKQLREFHISLIGNGNFKRWDRLNKKEQENLILLGKTAGYRYQIHDVAVPLVWIPGWAFQVKTGWENVGVAPHYEPAEVFFKLYDPRHSQYVWEAKSRVNLQTLLPTGDHPFTVQDNLELPVGTAPGSYQLRIIVEDLANYRKPLKLAITGRQNDGSYLLGTVMVASRLSRR